MKKAIVLAVIGLLLVSSVLAWSFTSQDTTPIKGVVESVDLKSTGYNVSFENGTSGDYVNITAVINVSGFPNTTFGLAGALTKIYFWNSSAKLKSG